MILALSGLENYLEEMAALASSMPGGWPGLVEIVPIAAKYDMALVQEDRCAKCDSAASDIAGPDSIGFGDWSIK